MAFITNDIIPLNRTEFGYAAIEGLAAGVMQPYILRFNAPLDEALVRRVLRQLVSNYPKLRAMLEAGPHRYHFRVLPDNHVVDQLFDLAFQVDAHINVDDPVALEAWHRRMLNEVVPLERGIGMRVRFVPHPERAVILFAVPHIFGDGMTMLNLVNQIVRGLNGLPMEPMAIEAPSMLGSVAPEHWWQWPRQVWRSRQHKVAEARLLKQLNVQQIPRRHSPNFSTTGLRHHPVPTGTKAMRQAARKLGVSMNTFQVAAIAQTFLEQAPNDPKAAAVIRISVNLRRYYPESAGHGPLWGNHVGAFLVIEQDPRKPLLERVRSVDALTKEGLARFTRREMCWTYLLEELMPWLGRTLVGYVGVQMKRHDRFPKISGHATSIGDVSSVINPPDVPVRIDRFMPSVASVAPLPGLVETDGQLFIPLSWQLAETSFEDVDDFLRRLDKTFERMVAEADLLPPPPAKA